jgi:hypothetical protein
MKLIKNEKMKIKKQESLRDLYSRHEVTPFFSFFIFHFTFGDFSIASSN